MNKFSALCEIARSASTDFEGASLVKGQKIDKASVRGTTTNGIAIEAAKLKRGRKEFSFEVWLDQLIRCPDDDKRQEYFWYGISTTQGAVKDLIEALPYDFKPVPISDFKGHFTFSDLHKVKRAGKKFDQFKEDLPKSLLGKPIEEKYSFGSFLGCFEKCESRDEVSNKRLANKIRRFWRSLAEAAAQSAKKGTASPNRKYIVRKITNNYEVFPSHTKLQLSFGRWLDASSSGKFDITHNANLVDTLLREKHTGRVTLVEVKPASSQNVAQYAAREAIGQLFQYRFEYRKSDSTPRLALVLGTEPGRDIRELLADLKIGLFWKSGKSFKGAFSS